MSTIFDNHGSIAVSSNQIVHKDQEKLSHRTRKRIREAKKKARPELSTNELWVEKNTMLQTLT